MNIICGVSFIQFFAHGEPIPQPRPRAFAKRFGSTYQARIYQPSTAESWKNCIASAAQAHIPPEPFSGPMRVDLAFYFKRPKDHYRKAGLKPGAPKYHTSRGDRDNLDKAVLDALQILGFFHDDGQVCEGEISKFYEVPGVCLPGCLITITPLENKTDTSAARSVLTAVPQVEMAL